MANDKKNDTVATITAEADKKFDVSYEKIKEKALFHDRTSEKAIVSAASGASVTIREDGQITLASNEQAQYKLNSDGKANEIALESVTTAVRKVFNVDELVINNHKLNPALYELADMRYLFGGNKHIGGGLTLLTTVLTKAWEPDLKRYVLIRRLARIPMFSPTLNLPDVPQGLRVGNQAGSVNAGTPGASANSTANSNSSDNTKTTSPAENNSAATNMPTNQTAAKQPILTQMINTYSTPSGETISNLTPSEQFTKLMNIAITNSGSTAFTQVEQYVNSVIDDVLIGIATETVGLEKNMQTVEETFSGIYSTIAAGKRVLTRTQSTIDAITIENTNMFLEKLNKKIDNKKNSIKLDEKYLTKKIDEKVGVIKTILPLAGMDETQLNALNAYIDQSAGQLKKYISGYNKFIDDQLKWITKLQQQINDEVKKQVKQLIENKDWQKTQKDVSDALKKLREYEQKAREKEIEVKAKLEEYKQQAQKQFENYKQQAINQVMSGTIKF